MYPWRRGPQTCSGPSNAGFAVKSVSKPLSVEAAEFVPRWGRQEEPTVPSGFGDGNCYLISLDGYSDDEEPVSCKQDPAKSTSTEVPAPAVASEAAARASATTPPERTPARRDTDEPSRPWRAPVSSGSAKVNNKTTADAKTKLPPWRRAPSKSVVTDVDDRKASSETRSVKQATVSQSSEGLETTDSGASMTTLDSDVATSEDSAEEEAASEQKHQTTDKEREEHEQDAGEAQEREADSMISEEHEQSSCATEAEPEAEEDASLCDPEPQEVGSEVAVFEVTDLLRWRSVVDVEGSSEHELPGRLIAWAEPTAEPSSLATSPKASSSSKVRRSPSSMLTASQSPASGSWRREADPREREECWEGRSEAPVRSEKTKLQVSENSWAAKMRERKRQQTDDPDERSDEEVIRAMKSILNKLTIEKFPQLYQQMVSCGIRTVDQLEQLIQEVFEKATTQHHFTDMYADLCAQLNTHFAKNPISCEPNMSFKKILLNACQASFEKNLTPPANLASMDVEERNQAEFEYKMRMLGNIRFVGALLVRKMLASKVMLAIIEELLGEPTPEALETLAALLTVVGGDFDTETFTHRVALNAIFAQVQGIVKKSSTPARVRCLLKDVLDLRASGWQDTKPKRLEKPTTLEEVHQKAATEDGNPLGSVGKGSANQWSTASQKSTGVRAAPVAASPCNSTSARKAKSPNTEAAPKEKSREEENFDCNACHAEVVRVLRELFVSYDVEEALTCIADIRIPASHQASELAGMLAQVAEEASAEKREVGFRFIAKLSLGRQWKRSELSEGLHSFIEDTCPDLKFDVPALQQIIREELRPALAASVEAGILQATQLEALATSEF